LLAACEVSEPGKATPPPLPNQSNPSVTQPAVPATPQNNTTAPPNTGSYPYPAP
jgi:hypothetical protein